MSQTRLKVYAAVALASEVTAVAFALTANITRQFDGSFHEVSRFLAGFGLVALGAALELIRGRANS